MTEFENILEKLPKSFEKLKNSLRLLYFENKIVEADFDFDRNLITIIGNTTKKPNISLEIVCRRLRSNGLNFRIILQMEENSDGQNENR